MPDWGRVTQDALEPVLLASARERGGDLRFYTELLSCTQDEAGVTATLLDRATGLRSTVRADYMLAADGANSPLRRQLNCSVSGRGSLGHLVNVLFKADLREFVRGRAFSLCRIDNPQVHGLFTSINLADVWVFHIGYDPHSGMTPELFTSEVCAELVRIALGLPEVEIEIKSIMPWESAMRVVDDFQQGRVFFAGDAAHQMPPWGGQGANSGIADVHNLAWKFATVLKGQAGPALLGTYNAERHPVDYLAADESAAAADTTGMMLFDGKRAATGFAARFPRIQGYYSYRRPSQAIILEKELAPDPSGMDGRPGTRVPHVWVEQQGRRISTLDLCNTSFILLSGGKGEAWCEVARRTAERLGIALVAYRIGPDGDLIDAENSWPGLAGIMPDGVLLVRPDGYVAWRAEEMVADPQQQLEQVFTQLLALEALKRA